MRWYDQTLFAEKFYIRDRKRRSVMGRKVTVIGAGNVGATIAYTFSLGDLASEIVILDIKKDKAEGEAMDIVQGASFRESISVISGDYEAARDSDVVVITSGINRKPGQTRLELTQINVEILKDITPQIVAVAPKAKYVLVSNPVDITTYVFTKLSGLPESQIMGTGTLLDTARLRYLISEHFHIAQKNVHAYVFGEHGDSSFIPWSCANISTSSFENYERLALANGFVKEPLDKEATINAVRKMGGEIIKRKGATFYAVSVSVSKLCDNLFSANDSLTTITSMMHGEYGISDICLSTLTMLGPKGIKGKVEIDIADDEIMKLRESAEALKAVIRDVKL